MSNPLDALFGKPDYSHLARDITVTVSLTALEMSAVLYAYDRGLDQLDEMHKQALNVVISKLKDEVHP